MNLSFTKISLLILFLPTLALAEPRTITVQGQGRVAQAPDMAVVSLGISHQEKTARAAMDAVSVNTRKVIDRLIANGVDEADIQTSGLSLHAVYDHRNQNRQPPEIIGFSGGTRLTVKHRNLDRLGDLLDQIVDAGANNLSGISFNISDPSAAYDAARRAAVADAMARAALYADAAAVELGDVLEISEVSAPNRPVPTARMEAMSLDSMPVSPGEIGISVQIWLKISLR